MFLLRTILVLCLCLSSLEAISSTFPRGCEVRGFAYDGRQLVLNERGEQTLYLIQNRHNQSIEMRRVEDPNVFMSPPLLARLETDHWAAFASDIQGLNFECLIPKKSALATNETSEKPIFEPVDCRDVLDVCQYPRVKFALSNMGNYWVTTNKSQSQVVHDTAAKGILLRW